jgi:hypothetical protein
MAWTVVNAVVLVVVSILAPRGMATPDPAHTLEVDGVPTPTLGLESSAPRLQWRLPFGRLHNQPQE